MIKLFARFYQFIIKIAYYFFKYPKQDQIIKDGGILDIPSILKNDGLEKPLIVTDNNLLKTGIVDSLFNKLQEEKVEYVIFSDVVPNPTCLNVEEGYKKYSENNCDSIIAIGGGSPMDVAKSIGAKATSPKKNIRKFLGIMKVHKTLPTLIAVPTTAGTGSEATIAAVLIDEKTNHKMTAASPKLFPRYAILDPSLTKGLPKFLTATTGMDALSHAVEAFTNKTYNTKYEDRLALEAIKLIYENLLVAYNDEENIEARLNMQIAAIKAGRSFSRGTVGYVHAIGHTFSALYKMGHGQTMAILLPKVLRQYGKKVYKRLAIISDYCGIGGETLEEKALNFISWIEGINKKMEIEDKPSMLKKDDIPQIVEWAYGEGVPLYPTPVTWNKKEFSEFLNSLLS